MITRIMWEAVRRNNLSILAGTVGLSRSRGATIPAVSTSLPFRVFRGLAIRLTHTRNPMQRSVVQAERAHERSVAGRDRRHRWCGIEPNFGSIVLVSGSSLVRRLRFLAFAQTSRERQFQRDTRVIDARSHFSPRAFFETNEAVPLHCLERSR